jgi:hypothetical protein
MNRFAFAIFILVSLIIATISCSNGTSPSGTASTATETTKPAAPEAAKPLDPKTLITDDKIGRFIVYQKEMNSVVDLAMSAGADALQNAGGSQKDLEKALSKDERAQKIANTQASALAKSGLTQTEATEITKILSPYIAGFTIGDDEMKEKSRQEMKSQYGEEPLAVFEKRLPELSKLQDEMLEKALGKKK